jgi:hypothetical protein
MDFASGLAILQTNPKPIRAFAADFDSAARFLARNFGVRILSSGIQQRCCYRFLKGAWKWQ